MQTAVRCARGADEQEQAERASSLRIAAWDGRIQQRSLQAHCSALHSLQLLSDTVLTYFSGKAASTWRTRNASTNNHVILSIYWEVQQAASVFFSEEGKLIKLLRQNNSFNCQLTGWMQQQLLFWCVTQALGCALWGEAGRGSLPGTHRDEALWKTSHLSGSPCQKFVWVASQFFSNFFACDLIALQTECAVQLPWNREKSYSVFLVFF